MNTLDYLLKKQPIIVALTNKKDTVKALESDANIIILIQADIYTLETVVSQFGEADKLVFVHIDLMKGLRRDPTGIEFLANRIGIDGIVTTNGNLIQTARQLHLLTIQRVFILDSASIKQGVKSLRKSQPDAVEILPGIAVPHIKNIIKTEIKQTIIAAGLINTEDEIIDILKNGAAGVSSSATELWESANQIKKRLDS